MKYTETTNQTKVHTLKTDTKEKRLRIMRTTKLDTITSMPSEDDRMQQLPPTGTLCKRMRQ